jgi:hypothetical protein
VQTKRFFIKVLVPFGTSLTVYEATEFSKLGFSVEKDSLLHNFTDEDTQLLKDGTVAWRGAREKHKEFLSIIIHTLTQRHDIVLDWHAATGFSITSLA